MDSISACCVSKGSGARPILRHVPLELNLLLFPVEQSSGLLFAEFDTAGIVVRFLGDSGASFALAIDMRFLRDETDEGSRCSVRDVDGSDGVAAGWRDEGGVAVKGVAAGLPLLTLLLLA